MFIVTMIAENGRHFDMEAFATREEAEEYATSLNADYIINELNRYATPFEK